MNHPFLSTIWARAAVFLWLVVFPLVFIIVPVAELMTGEGKETAMPVWALVIWMLGPAVVSIAFKYLDGNAPSETNENESSTEQGKKK